MQSREVGVTQPGSAVVVVAQIAEAILPVARGAKYEELERLGAPPEFAARVYEEMRRRKGI